MSAYALPGSLFLPGSFSSVASSKSSLSSSGKVSMCSGDSRPLQNPRAKKARGEGERGEVGIAVKAAKIDPVRLVQPATRRNKSRRTENSATKRLSRSVHSRAPGLANLGTIGNPTSRVNPTQSKPVQTPSCYASAPHEEAIEFELCINLNGRKYSATRTLPSIIALRDELVRELDRRRNTSRLRQLPWSSALVAQERDLCIKDDGIVDTVDEYTELDQDTNVIIPELPTCIAGTETVATGGFANRGFRLLQAMTHSYCPAIERWLRQVADVVPPNSSPCLMNFLWEPLSQNWGSEDKSGLKRDRSFATPLDIIDESNDGGTEAETNKR